MPNIFDSVFPGNTFPYSGLLNMITDARTENDQCEMKFNSDIKPLLGSKLFIGTVSNINQILAITLTFHDTNGDLVRDDNDQPIQYTSNRQDFGHILDILHQGFAFSYAKCLFRLKPNSNFDINNIFFHFSQSLSSKNNKIYKQRIGMIILVSKTGIITGPTPVWVNTIAQPYNVSIRCPFYATCMWLLDGNVINNMPDTSIMLTFEQKHVGNRTLSYVGYTGNVPQTLASLPLSILSTNQTGKVYYTYERSR
jgi:hypothetical protein